MKFITNAALCIALAGCSAMTTTGQLQPSLEHSYIGRQAEDFFRANGLPSNAMRTQAGGTLYEWRSDVVVTQMPVTSTANVVGNTAFIRSSGGQSLQQFCVVALEADTSGKIVGVRIATDTIGQWAVSRCAEVLRL
jgi:hypothetical protein